jgi:hypothetical protein
MALAAASPVVAPAADDSFPARLADTGLHVAGSVHEISAGIETFTPQYPLWSDGAHKQRWIRLPASAAIDAAQPAAWAFPNGTTFWKEFSKDGRRVETRMIERGDAGDWRFVAFIWNEDGTDATLANPRKSTRLTLPDGSRYTVPSEADCRACHAGAAVPILGFSALQLSADRDPLAPHAEPAKPGDLDLAALVASGRLVNLPKALAESPPRVRAATPAGRAALGYLHANCGNCHVDPKLSSAAVPVEMQLALDPADPDMADSAVRRLVGSESRYRAQDAADARVVVPGNAAAGTLLARMRSRDPRIQMPPLGSAIPDRDAIALLERWINEELGDLKENER